MGRTGRQGSDGDGATWPLPEGSLAGRAAAWLATHTPESYLVGGYIRDGLLGKESHDVDFVVAQDSLSLARSLANHLEGHFVPLDRRRGIARIVCHERGETTYVDLARLQGRTLRQDLTHRDLTINAIALRLRGDRPCLIDPHHGQEDLEWRLIRAVTPRAFTDDPLRLLRAVRLAAELEFEIEPSTEALLRRDAPLIRRSAAERIRYELVKILRAPQAPRWVCFLMDTGLLSSILPQLGSRSGPYLGPAMAAFADTHRLIALLKEGDLGSSDLQALAPFAGDLLAHLSRPTSGERHREDILRMAALLSPLPVDDVRSALLALRFSNAEIRCGQSIAIHWRQAQQLSGPCVPRRAIYRFFREAGDAGVEALLLALSYSTGHRRERLAEAAAHLLEAYFHRYRELIAPPPLLDGRRIMSELNLEPGPRIGDLLAALREAQAAGEVRTVQEALAFARAWALTH